MTISPAPIASTDAMGDIPMGPGPLHVGALGRREIDGLVEVHGNVVNTDEVATDNVDQLADGMDVVAATGQAAERK